MCCTVVKALRNVGQTKSTNRLQLSLNFPKVAIVIFRSSSSLGGALAWAGASGVIALLGWASISTDPECDYGYVVQSATTCVESGGLWVARIAGISFGLTLASIVWSFLKSLGGKSNY